MSDREAYRRIRPRNVADWRALLAIPGCLALAGLCVVGLLYLKDRVQEDRERNWDSAIAMIEDVRTKPAMQVESRRGGGMLYGVQVLAKYSAGDKTEERWITVEQTPRGLGEAQLEAFRWKGKTCFVRWKPSNPEVVIAEVH